MPRRVPSTLRPLLGASAAPKDELYSEEQMRSVLDAYAAADNLQIDSSNVKLDKLMVSNLFNKKEPQMEGDACSLEEVVKRLLGKLQLFHKVTRVTEQVGIMLCAVVAGCRQCTIQYINRHVTAHVSCRMVHTGPCVW